MEGSFELEVQPAEGEEAPEEGGEKIEARYIHWRNLICRCL